MTDKLQFPALSKDIRKTPDYSLSVNARTSKSLYPHASSSGPSNGSTIAVEQTDATHDSSMTLVTKGLHLNGGIKNSDKSLTWANQPKLTGDMNNAWLGGERYWSEFNNEDDEDEPYTILIHPSSEYDEDEPTGMFGRMSKHLQKVFGYDDDEPKNPSEDSPLLMRSNVNTSDDDLESGMSIRRQSTSRYHAIAIAAKEHKMQQRQHERMLFRGYCLSFAISIIILAGAAGWVLTRNPNKRGPNSEVGTGVGETLAVFLAAVFAAYGVTLFVARKDRLNFLHKATVIGLFVLICLSGSLVLSLAYSNWLRP